MPSRPVVQRSTELPLSRVEWDLLAHLPYDVLVAATSAEPDRARQTVAEGQAGWAAVAAGRRHPSPLVREVALALDTIRDAADDEPPAAEEFSDREDGIAGVIAKCRAAARVLGQRVSSADGRAYQEWVMGIAERVCSAARTGPALGFGLIGPEISAAERRFLDDLRRALAV